MSVAEEVRRGNALMGAGKFDAAVEVYEATLRRKPCWSPATLRVVRLNRAKALKNSGRLGEAIAAFEECGNDAEAERLVRETRVEEALAGALAASSPSEEAAALERALTFADDGRQYATVVYNLGVVRLNASRFDEARECLRTVLDLDPSRVEAREALTTLAYNEGAAALNAGRLDAALEAFAAVLEVEPEHDHAKRGLLAAEHNLGVAALRVRDFATARCHLEEVRRSDPENAAARSALRSVDVTEGTLLARDRKFAQAIPMLERVVRDGGDGAEVAACAYNLVVAYLELGYPRDARRALEKALAHDPAHALSLRIKQRVDAAVAAYDDGPIYEERRGREEEEEEEEEVEPPPVFDAARGSDSPMVASLARCLSEIEFERVSEIAAASAKTAGALDASSRASISVPENEDDSSFVRAAISVGIARRAGEEVGLDGDKFGERIRRHYAGRRGEFFFEDVAPRAFADVRRLVGVSAEYATSMRALAGNGSFLTTRDSRFVAKTLARTEFRFLRRILASYHAHIQAHATSTLLCKFLGLYVVRRAGLPRKSSKIIVVMSNVLRAEGGSEACFDEIYHLKGALTDRFVTNQERARGATILKDMNFANNDRRLYLGTLLKPLFLQALKTDVQWLSDNKIMDYTFLVALATCNNADTSQRSDHHHLIDGGGGGGGDLWRAHNGGIKASVGATGSYFFGVVDILQEYNLRKKVQHVYRARLAKHRGADPKDICCVPPRAYGRRFEDFIAAHVA
ncbi:hypothetical protein CTAYLR_008864 [Chrysophaeum taylorii]|uniref:PIPK domain-containing protein n=1 Tax=Chrysophaeum taylorii TaxID=2483200 RepID=A0AAD7U799_9STRA|nr:hypothetical protein CTAYLR_008864 [Chrysophaeum taylorii]